MRKTARGEGGGGLRRGRKEIKGLIKARSLENSFRKGRQKGQKSALTLGGRKTKRK